MKSFSVTVNPLEPVRLTPVSFSNGQFTMSINGTPGPDFIITASSNLTFWSDLATNLSPTLPFQFTDFSAGSNTNRAYRVRLDP